MGSLLIVTLYTHWCRCNPDADPSEWNERSPSDIPPRYGAVQPLWHERALPNPQHVVTICTKSQRHIALYQEAESGEFVEHVGTSRECVRNVDHLRHSDSTWSYCVAYWHQCFSSTRQSYSHSSRRFFYQPYKVNISRRLGKS